MRALPMTAVTKGTSNWLAYSNKQTWLEFLGRFPVEMQDVYYLPDYVYLHENETEQAVCFTYTEGSHAFLHCFLLSDIPGSNGYRDISTAYGYGGPIANTQDVEFVLRAYRTFQEQAVEHRAIAERIRFHPLLNNHQLMAAATDVRIIDVCPTVQVDIMQDEADRWSRVYSHANRKSINKARREVTITFGREQRLWDAYRELYTETMDANAAQAFYYFPDVYYERMRRNLAEHYILAAAHIEGRIVSVLLLLLSPVFAHCHRIGTRREALSQGTNNLLHHEVIQWCKAQGITTLLIGGGRGNSADDSLFRFKQQFSDVTGRFHVGECILDQRVFARLCEESAATPRNGPRPETLFRYRA